MSNLSPAFRPLSPEETEAQVSQNLAAKRRSALLFGVLAGLFYALVAWGADSYLLSNSHSMLPWLLFSLGLVPSLLIGLLAAWAAYRFNHTLASFIIWLLAGLLMAWVTVRVSFRLYPWVLDQLLPDTAPLLEYPLYRSIDARAVIVTIAVTVLFVLAGMLSVALIEGFAESSALFGRIIPVLVWAALFGVAGFVTHDNYNWIFSQPVAGTDTWIQFVLNSEGVTLSKELAASMRVRAAEPIREVIHRPRRLILSSYDEWFSTTHVWIDFDGAPVSCWVIDNKVSTCERLDQ